MSGKFLYLTSIVALTFGMPLALQPVFAAADQTIEGCHWSDTQQKWVYQDNGMCRGTGEDPTVDAAGLPSCSKGTPVSEFRFGTTTYTCKEGV